MINYFTNRTKTSKSLTEWYFGKKFVSESTKTAKQKSKKTGESTFKFWKDGTGYLTIVIG